MCTDWVADIVETTRQKSGLTKSDSQSFFKKIETIYGKNNFVFLFKQFQNKLISTSTFCGHNKTWFIKDLEI